MGKFPVISSYRLSQCMHQANILPIIWVVLQEQKILQKKSLQLGRKFKQTFRSRVERFFCMLLNKREIKALQHPDAPGSWVLISLRLLLLCQPHFDYHFLFLLHKIYVDQNEFSKQICPCCCTLLHYNAIDISKQKKKFLNGMKCKSSGTCKYPLLCLCFCLGKKKKSVCVFHFCR